MAKGIHAMDDANELSRSGVATMWGTVLGGCALLGDLCLLRGHDRGTPGFEFIAVVANKLIAPLAVLSAYTCSTLASAACSRGGLLANRSACLA